MAQIPDVKRVAIIGTGLIGGSIGLALKAAALPGIEIVGYDRDQGKANQAQKMGALDHAEHSLSRAVRDARLVIIAAPILAVREVMQQVAPDLGQGTIVTDTASTKAHVMGWAAELLPEGVSFVGGHPMAGKETQGIENAEATMFRGRAYCICPAVNAGEGAIKSVVGLARVLGAEPLFMDPEEHDQYAAAVSHLPLMASTALFTLMRSSPAWEDLAAMASSGFRDATRLASGDPAMSHGVWTTNREAIIHWLERMSGELMRIRDQLKDAQDEALLQMFASAQLERDLFIQKPPRREPERGPSLDAREMMTKMFLGGMMTEQLKKAQKIPELMRETQVPAGEGKKKISLAEKIAEDVRRDLEKLEKKRADRERERGPE